MNTKLEELIKLGCIKSYKISNVSEDGVVGAKSHFNNDEQLYIEFPNGQNITIDTYHTTFSQNTGLLIQ